jgi:hypothetical protein
MEGFKQIVGPSKVGGGASEEKLPCVHPWAWRMQVLLATSKGFRSGFPVRRVGGRKYFLRASRSGVSARTILVQPCKSRVGAPRLELRAPNVGLHRRKVCLRRFKPRRHAPTSPVHRCRRTPRVSMDPVRRCGLPVQASTAGVGGCNPCVRTSTSIGRSSGSGAVMNPWSTPASRRSANRRLSGKRFRSRAARSELQPLDGST